MIDTRSPLRIDELGQLAGLLLRYKTELEYEADDGRALDECDKDARLRQYAIDDITNCLQVICNDLKYRLSAI